MIMQKEKGVEDLEAQENNFASEQKDINELQDILDNINEENRFRTRQTCFKERNKTNC